MGTGLLCKIGQPPQAICCCEIAYADRIDRKALSLASEITPLSVATDAFSPPSLTRIALLVRAAAG